jgi:branched-chain amino acid transport system ATP-binding protein
LLTKAVLFSIGEPSLGLTPNLVVFLFHTIKSLHDEGLTILIVEQHVPQVLQIADRAYVLENGSLVLEGAAEEVFNNERTKTAYLGL